MDKRLMSPEPDRKLVFADGTEYYGYGFGCDCDRVCEVVFNTSPVGYQEIISDPSYTYQAVVMTYPLIGNYGIADEDFETKIPTVGGLIVREYNDSPSNFRCTKTLSEVMEEYKIPGISGVDTRKLTRSIRDRGTRRALITSASTPVGEALEVLEAVKAPRDAVSRVSCRKRWYARTSGAAYSVVAVDFGIKLNIIRSLNRRGCNVTVVPYDTPAEEIIKMRPDGVFLSNGPGDPQDVPGAVELINMLKGRYPMFGICLGHQLIGLACGAETYKLKFGHRGGNHPVKNLTNGRVEITSQNHSYAVNRDSLSGTGLEITHINLLDNTVEGMECAADRVFSVQYHPESAPGPQDSAYLFDKFVSLMKEAKHNAKENRY
ncbi:MAG: glutamine-hydrolyzing carbamoyl-phosphate synthase small subunit [Firmicutes bacterium]|jgi:carbamoyl-phosphate synthase small subunit|uniref:Carbamoyl phosphate synthase small chain n=1 Tax=Candidatus Colimorpha enterica TaxID=3083063 RepID=A0AAE3K4M5_9BACT|nr:glutamine-hydrolyzing carbamoyl-phosphate synthase small subunit [Candidatus Colimorpha enterica]MDY2906388.1 glutamine-hydrolyzing carbamoyl-phosphate synthase small subunit [Eubacteriales bacterium]